MSKNTVKIIYEDGREEFLPLGISTDGNVTTCTLKKSDVPKGTKYADFILCDFEASEGEDGYFVMPGGATEGTHLVRFNSGHKEGEVFNEFAYIGCIGVKKDNLCGVCIAVGERYDFASIFTAKDGKYTLYPRFLLDGDEPYEDLSVEMHLLEGGDYSAMAREYRKFKLERCGVRPLRERIKDNPALGYAANSIEVRVRQGWKPVPSPVEEQTPETEPEMFAACTFDRVGDIVDEFKKQGIDNAEFCLVGWSVGGHDGRHPQIFPADPKLGGDEGLKKLIDKTREKGYNIVCHTSSTAAYRIADCFDEEYLVKNKDGSLMKRPYLWGGGRPYKVCPMREYKRFDVSDTEKLKELGFYGIHYIDVITILPLIKCYDEKHPLDRKGSAEYYKKTMELCRRNIGGFASEGGFDFAAEGLDYCMYVAFNVLSAPKCELCDEEIPFWELIYHGIVLYNPCTDTLNYPAKGVKNRLKYYEYGGRPLVCYYANFAKGNNWMGLEDFITDTDEHLIDSVSKIKTMAEDFEKLRRVRFEYMESHRKVSDGVYETVYSDGTCVTVDYNSEKVTVTEK